MARQRGCGLAGAREGQTRFLLSGFLPDALPRAALHQLLSVVAYWSSSRSRLYSVRPGPGRLHRGLVRRARRRSRAPLCGASATGCEDRFQ